MTVNPVIKYKVIFCTINIMLCCSSVWLWAFENCCGQHVVRHQTAASSNPSDMFVSPSVEDIKTCRAEMNDLLLLNWITEPGDENQKSRGGEWEKRREKRVREIEWGRVRPVILQLSGSYGSHEVAQPYRKRQAQGKGKDKQGQWRWWGRGGDGVNQRGRSEWSSGFVCQVVFCGGSSHISAFTEQIKITAWNLPFSRAH